MFIPISKLQAKTHQYIVFADDLRSHGPKEVDLYDSMT